MKERGIWAKITENKYYKYEDPKAPNTPSYRKKAGKV